MPSDLPKVSIPNGKPILFRRDEMQAPAFRHGVVSIPNGKPILFRLPPTPGVRQVTASFQSQTGSPSSSDVRCFYPVIIAVEEFQSQTGSPSSSDFSFLIFQVKADLMFQSHTGSPSSSDCH